MLKKVARISGGLVLVLSLAAFATGCKNKSDDISLPPDATTSANDGLNGNTDGLPVIDENTIFGDAGLKAIYFDYNSYTLRADAIDTLTQNAGMIRQVPGIVIQIEGHCDDRGTQEYNLALGEKRALAVREYLIKLGIAADHMITISYGEEMPAVQGTGEAVWAQNRRAKFNKAM